MKLIAVTGNTGTGKTTFVKNLIRKSSHEAVIFDINNEYGNFGLCFFDKEELLDYLQTVKNRLVVIDEATAFFSYRSYDNQLNKILQLRRHNNHFIVFVYHSLNFIPKYLRMYLNYIVVFQQVTDVEEINGVKIEFPKEKYKCLTFKIM